MIFLLLDLLINVSHSCNENKLNILGYVNVGHCTTRNGNSTHQNQRQFKEIVGTSNVVIASDYFEDSSKGHSPPLDLFETSTHLPTSHANNICLPNRLNNKPSTKSTVSTSFNISKCQRPFTSYIFILNE